MKFYLAAITAYVIWGFFSLVLKPLHDYSSVDILFYRVFSCAILMLLITFLFRRKKLKETLQLFKRMSPQEKRRTSFTERWGQYFLNGKLVLVYLCYESHQH